jgi:hypothetical protein
MNSNPYESPAMSPPDRNAAGHRAQSALGLRHLWGNLLLNMLFWGGVMVLDWVEVRRVPINARAVEIGGWLVLAGFVLGTLILNWKLTCAEEPIRRLVLALVVGVSAFTTIGAVCGVLFMWFHTAIGGSL